jgi:hypothetical protein
VSAMTAADLLLVLGIVAIPVVLSFLTGEKP